MEKQTDYLKDIVVFSKDLEILQRERRYDLNLNQALKYLEEIYPFAED